MDILFIGENPTVKRLVELSAAKTGLSLTTTGWDDAELDNAKFLIAEAEALGEDATTVLVHAPRTLRKILIAPRETAESGYFDVMLRKPFLPTELVELFVNTVPVADEGNDPAANESFADDEPLESLPDDVPALEEEMLLEDISDMDVVFSTPQEPEAMGEEEEPVEAADASAASETINVDELYSFDDEEPTRESKDFVLRAPDADEEEAIRPILDESEILKLKSLLEDDERGFDESADDADESEADPYTALEEEIPAAIMAEAFDAGEADSGIDALIDDEDTFGDESAPAVEDEAMTYDDAPMDESDVQILETGDAPYDEESGNPDEDEAPEELFMDEEETDLPVAEAAVESVGEDEEFDLEALIAQETAGVVREDDVDEEAEDFDEMLEDAVAQELVPVAAAPAAENDEEFDFDTLLAAMDEESVAAALGVESAVDDSAADELAMEEISAAAVQAETRTIESVDQLRELLETLTSDKAREVLKGAKVTLSITYPEGE